MNILRANYIQFDIFCENIHRTGKLVLDMLGIYIIYVLGVRWDFEVYIKETGWKDVSKWNW
jgi:hypothetical protein